MHVYIPIPLFVDLRLKFFIDSNGGQTNRMNRDEALSSFCQHSHYHRLSLELHVYIYISSIESLCMQGVAALTGVFRCYNWECPCN